MSDQHGLSDTENISAWTTALTDPRPETTGPGRKLLRKWLQQAWGRHFNPDQGAMWDLAQTLALPYKLFTEVLWPILKWFWDLHKILFNPNHTFRENWEELRALPSEILGLLKQVEHRPEKVLTADEVEREVFLGPSPELSLENFRYDPLEDHMGRSTVRIVELLPGKGLQTIECHLRELVLQRPRELENRSTFNVQETNSGDAGQDQEQDTPVSYEALSYCWGDNTLVKTPIVCNGARLDIARNLKSALQHLRDEENIRVLWIDAICINQEDLAEREQQVRHMREIYQQAERVVVWLGEAADDSDVALSLCARVALVAALNIDQVAIERLNYSTITSPDPKSYPWNSKEARKAATAFLKQAGESTGQEDTFQVLNDRCHDKYDDTIDKAEVIALQNLAKRPWFTRMWITQEIGVAREALLVCGKTKMDWGLFDLGYSLTLLTGEMRRYLDKDIARNGMGRLTILRRILASKDELSPMEKKQLTLPVLLNSFRKHKATDPRDKVFALFGLTSTDIEAVNLRPDYHSSVEDVYKNVARGLMESSKDLYILSIPRSDTDLSRHLPSWVPDWTDTSPHPALFSRYSEATDNMSPVPIPSYKASNGTRLPSHPTFESDGTLCLSGYVIDEIAQLSDVYAPPTHDFLSQKFETYTTISPWHSWLSMLDYLSSLGHSLDVLYSWRALALHPPPPHPSFSSSSSSSSSSTATLKEQFRRTLSADWSPNGPSTTAADFTKWDKQFHAIALLRLLGLRRILPRLYHAGAVVGVATYWLFQGTDGAFSNAIECAPLRRLAWTEGGRLALVPREVVVGDAVALVRGGDVPLVVREVVGVEAEESAAAAAVGKRWTLVGGGYVHGVMYGEGWEVGRCGEIVLV